MYFLSLASPPVALRVAPWSVPDWLIRSPLKAAPHTWETCFEDEWDKPYTREQAAFPAPWVKANKFWPTVGRVDNVHGDRNLVSLVCISSIRRLGVTRFDSDMFE